MQQSQPAAIDFERDFAPWLARRCLGCHNPSDLKGGLDLTRPDSLATGGDSGPAVVAGDAEASLIWQRIEAGEMPPSDDQAKLPDAERQMLRQWIAAGARWSGGPIDPLKFTSDRRAGTDWWSLRPLADPAEPDVADRAWVTNPIDSFVLARLEATGLRPSPPAELGSLIRRLTFDLIGLPPTPEEIDAFINDPSPRAYEALVDRLLASPHYGERWARHWLDVVRYAESQGFERDRLRPNAWQYRDWVVQAFNDDLPYDVFIRWQLAGDVLRPDDPRAVIATGFLVAGPWDEVGQTQQSEAMKAVVRQDELEDLVGTTAQTFLGLTAHCARCHDHKFDPISQVDYYRLSAALSGVRHGERAAPPAGDTLAEDLKRLTTDAAEARTRLADIERPVRAKLLAERLRGASPIVPPEPIAHWEFDGDARDAIGELHGDLRGGARIENGQLVLPGGEAHMLTAPLGFDLEAKTLEAWVRLSGAPTTGLDQRGGGVIGVQSRDGNVFDTIVYGERVPRRWTAGSNFFVRTKDISDSAADETEATQRPVHVAITYASDGTITLYRNGRAYGDPYPTSGVQKFAAVGAQVVFGVRHSPPGMGKMLIGAIDRARLYDRALTAAEVAASAGLNDDTVTDDDILVALAPAERDEWRSLRLDLSRLESRRRLLSGGTVHAVAPKQPEPTRVLRRGDTRQPGDVVAAGPVAAASRGQADFGLPPDAPEAERRRRLADWLASPDNPLTARVMANRLWHYHFGTGLVDTPNDFGFNGGRPTHPELLDWLARQLIDHGWHLKQLHRTIVLSSTYRQASPHRPAAAQIDAGNRLYWRKTPTRLEAEMLRDAVLAVSGQLNPAVGGPGYQDFKTFTNNSQFYEVYDPPGYGYQRRSLYRTCIRSGTSPLLDVLDCPDPSTTAPARAVTTTPLQALALLNDSFMLRMSDQFAERLHREAGDDPAKQASLAYRLAFGRAPTALEQSAAQALASEHGLAALARVLFNANEFLYLD